MKNCLLDALWCIALSIYIVAGIQLVPFHGDESTLIFMGRDFYYLLEGKSVNLQAWEALSPEEASEQQLRLLNGTIPKYIYGMVAYFQGYSIDMLNEQWAWGSGWQWNHENGHVPSQGLLMTSRIASAIQTAIGTFLIFAIVFQLGSRRAAYIASAFYSLHPAILLNGRRAMMEGSPLVFTLLLVLITILFIKHRHEWFYFLLGLVAGLALASKHTTVVTILTCFAFCAVYYVWQSYKNQQNVLKPVNRLILAGMLALMVFYILNPAWWGQASAPKVVLILREGIVEGQLQSYGGYQNLGEQFAGFLKHVFLVPPMYSEVDIDGFLTEQLDIIAQYEQSGLAGLSLGLVGALITGLGFILGFLALWKNQAISKVLAVFIVLWTASSFLLSFISPFEWQRYYIPAYPALAVLFALGIDFILKLIPRKFA
jgi:4-amino-4-deoxy-L-arabinose transferase-like glycosyltransferase